MLPGVELGGRVVIVTGAARGIGRALALRAAAEGAAGVVAVDLDGEGAERTAQEIEAAGARALGLGAGAVEVRDRHAARALLGKPPCHRTADPGRPARDHGGTVAKLHV